MFHLDASLRQVSLYFTYFLFCLQACFSSFPFKIKKSKHEEENGTDLYLGCQTGMMGDSCTLMWQVCVEEDCERRSNTWNIVIRRNNHKQVF